MTPERTLLLVEDEALVQRQLLQGLDGAPLRVTVADSAEAALDLLADHDFDLVLTDLMLPGISGNELVRQVRSRHLAASVLVMTAFGTIDAAMEAIGLGAVDFLVKPLDPQYLRLVIERTLADRSAHDEVRRLRGRLGRRSSFQDIIGRSPRMGRVFDLMAQVAGSGATVLIEGETGTGKELVARGIHQCDTTRTGPLVAVNCAALPASLLESELFGHERGSFSGAVAQKPGRFELAHRGTLFLDEVGDMPLAMQAKLLRVLQSSSFERVGGSATITVDVRLLAATNSGLARAVKRGTFRRDLFYRLNVVHLELPPLRDRAEDIPLLVDHFLDHLCARNQVPRKRLARDTMDLLIRYHWPGNVRELENLIEQLVITGRSDRISPADLPPQIIPTRERPLSLDYDIEQPLQALTAELTTRIEREYFQRLLQRYQGSLTRCADHSGLSRRSVGQKLRQLGINKSEFTPPAPAARRGARPRS